jgi:hypothetical protein
MFKPSSSGVFSDTEFVDQYTMANGELSLPFVNFENHAPPTIAFATINWAPWQGSVLQQHGYKIQQTPTGG